MSYRQFLLFVFLLLASGCYPRVTEVFNPTEWIYASWSSPEGTVWFAGGKGQITRVKNGQVDSFSLPTNLDFAAIWGCTEDRVWAAGGHNRLSNEAEEGMLWEWDGHQWKRVPTNFDASVSIRSLGGSSCENIWMGGRGKMAHFDGKSWSEVPYPPFLSLFKSIAVVSPTEAYADDLVSHVYKWDGVAWKIFEHRAVSDPKDRATFDGIVRGVKIINNHLVAWWDDTFDGLHIVAIFKENKWHQTICRERGMSEITAVAGNSTEKLWVTTSHLFPGGPLFEIENGQCRKRARHIGSISTLSVTPGTLWLGGDKILRINISSL